MFGDLFVWAVCDLCHSIPDANSNLRLRWNLDGESWDLSSCKNSATAREVVNIVQLGQKSTKSPQSGLHGKLSFQFKNILKNPSTPWNCVKTECWKQLFYRFKLFQLWLLSRCIVSMAQVMNNVLDHLRYFLQSKTSWSLHFTLSFVEVFSSIFSSKLWNCGHFEQDDRLPWS